MRIYHNKRFQSIFSIFIGSFKTIFIFVYFILLLFPFCESYRMSSIKNFFPTVGGVSNKRQKLTETAYAAISSVVSGGERDGSADEAKDEGPLKSSGESPVAAPGVADAPTSVPLTGFQPFDEMEISWRSRLYAEHSKPYFQRLLTFLDQEYKTKTVFPPQSQVFTALNLCTYDKVKVVIIGQDPYHGPGQAHGLAFSVQHGVPAPPSLKNMINEAHNDLGIPKPKHGNLEHWSRQGVLLLNTVLTVRQSEANSHQKKGYDVTLDLLVPSLTMISLDGRSLQML